MEGMTARFAFGVEFGADDCLTLRRTAEYLLWRRYVEEKFVLYFTYCAGWRCNGLAAEVRGKPRSATRFAARLIWSVYRYYGGRALRVEFWRLYRYREPELYKTYVFGKRPTASCGQWSWQL